MTSRKERAPTADDGMPGKSPMDNRKIVELTVGELEEIISRTVKKSVAEVMIEFALEADVEAQVAYEAEINDLLRQEMQTVGAVADAEFAATTKVDD
ncbi:MAG: hypothetical protein OXG53_07605 [Chloroflexi bacterium]|nr:hypothetical protein [Chloroflexota bacterium]